MHLGIVATGESAEERLVELARSAVRRHWQCRCFLTGAGVKLLRSQALLDLSRQGKIRLDVCEHSWELLGAGEMPAGIHAGSQYQNAELAHLCDRIVVL